MTESKLKWPVNGLAPIERRAIATPVLLDPSPGFRDALAALFAGREWRYPVVAACLLIYFLPFLRVLTLPVDEGWCLTDAARVFRGELPFRDFFEFVGPGTFYWIALFFSLFGENWFATRVCVLVGGMATALLIYFLARRLKPGSEIGALIFWLAVSFPAWPAINHHLVANIFALAAFGLAIAWLGNNRPGVLIMSGIAAGLTASVFFQKGALLGLALVLTLWLQSGRARRLAPIGQFLSGAILVGAVVASYFWARGGLSHLIYANFVWPLQNYSEVGHVTFGFGLADNLRGLASIHPVGGLVAAAILAIPSLVVLLLPLTLAVLGFFFRSICFNSKTLPYWLAGSALWISEAHRPDMIHLILGSPLLIVLCFSIMHGIRTQAMSHARRVVTGSAGILAGATMLVCLMANVSTSTPVGSATAFTKSPVIDFTNSHVKPGETLFVYPYSPIYYFLSGASNPTRFSYLLYRHHTRDQMLEVIASLEKDKTRYIVWDTNFETVTAAAILPSYRPPSNADRVIEPYLNSHYKEIGFEKGFRFMERRSHPLVIATLGF